VDTAERDPEVPLVWKIGSLMLPMIEIVVAEDIVVVALEVEDGGLEVEVPSESDRVARDPAAEAALMSAALTNAERPKATAPVAVPVTVTAAVAAAAEKAAATAAVAATAAAAVPQRKDAANPAEDALPNVRRLLTITVPVSVPNEMLFLPRKNNLTNKMLRQMYNDNILCRNRGCLASWSITGDWMNAYAFFFSFFRVVIIGVEETAHQWFDEMLWTCRVLLTCIEQFRCRDRSF